MPARGIHHEDIANLRYRMVEVERRSAAWRCEEYRMLLEQFCGDVGQSAAQTELEGGQPVDSSSSRSAPATPSGLTPQRQQVLPSLVARQDDDDRECHQGTSASPELVPPGRVRHRLDNEEVFVGTVAALCADNSSRNRSAIFSLAGLCDHQLTSLEAAWDKKTPDMPWLTFAKVFGRTLYSERPLAEKVKGYVGSFLCTNNVVQPFAPKRVGEPGVILFPPGTVLLEDTKERFHVLVDPSADQRTRLQYRGIYTKVHTPSIMEVQPDEWHALPRQCRREWLRRLWRQVAGDIHARCILRKRLGSEPSLAQIQEWLRKFRDGTESKENAAIPESFNSGVEKFGFEVIKCVGYDVKLAKLIRDGTNRLGN